MSIFSARRKLETLDNPSGYCFPLALDSILKTRTLPDEFYDLFSTESRNEKSSFNTCVEFLLKDFFGVEPEPDSELAAVAKYNAFGASVQSYCPDAPYDYTDEFLQLQSRGATWKQLRLRELLVNARNNNCYVLFTNPNNIGEHVSGLDQIDPGDSGYSSTYVVRDMVEIQNNRLFSTNDLSGINLALGQEPAVYAPLPEVSRQYFPGDSSSWELIILPPEPEPF